MKFPPRPFFLLPVLLLAAAGCRNGGTETTTATTTTVVAQPIKAVPDKDRYKVKADTTGLFRFSPLQASGADVELKKDARLTMVNRGRGFSQVKTTDDQVGYVGTEDIVLLAPAEIAQEDAATIQAAQAAAGVQMAGPLPLAVAGAAPAATPKGGKKTGASSGPAVTIPSDAGRNERLPEADARPSATPGVNFR